MVEDQAPFAPEQSAGRAYPGDNGEQILLFRVFLSDVFNVVNQIVILLDVINRLRR